MLPLLTDTHTHTIHCGHARPTMTVANLLAAADTAGLERVVITEHVHRSEHLSERIERIRAEAAASTHACEVYIGAEMDADGAAMDGSLAAATDGLAYVIASTHHYPGGRHFWNSHPQLTAAERAAAVEGWFAWAQRIVANPAVDTLAHPGALLAQNGLTANFAGGLLDGFREVFAVAAAHDTLIELNELLARKLTPAHRADYPAVMRAAVDAGCRIVVASDAHDPEAVGAFRWVREVLGAAGLTQEELALPRWRTPGISQRH